MSQLDSQSTPEVQEHDQIVTPRLQPHLDDLQLTSVSYTREELRREFESFVRHVFEVCILELSSYLHYTYALPCTSDVCLSGEPHSRVHIQLLARQFCDLCLSLNQELVLDHESPVLEALVCLKKDHRMRSLEDMKLLCGEYLWERLSIAMDLVEGKTLPDSCADFVNGKTQKARNKTRI